MANGWSNVGGPNFSGISEALARGTAQVTKGLEDLGTDVDTAVRNDFLFDQKDFYDENIAGISSRIANAQSLDALFGEGGTRESFLGELDNLQNIEGADRFLETEDYTKLRADATKQVSDLLFSDYELRADEAITNNRFSQDDLSQFDVNKMVQQGMDRTQAVQVANRYRTAYDAENQEQGLFRYDEFLRENNYQGAIDTARRMVEDFGYDAVQGRALINAANVAQRQFQLANDDREIMARMGETVEQVNQDYEDLIDMRGEAAKSNGELVNGELVYANERLYIDNPDDRTVPNVQKRLEDSGDAGYAATVTRDGLVALQGQVDDLKVNVSNYKTQEEFDTAVDALGLPPEQANILKESYSPPRVVRSPSARHRARARADFASVEAFLALETTQNNGEIQGLGISDDIKSSEDYVNNEIENQRLFQQFREENEPVLDGIASRGDSIQGELDRLTAKYTNGDYTYEEYQARLNTLNSTLDSTIDESERLQADRFATEQAMEAKEIVRQQITQLENRKSLLEAQQGNMWSAMNEDENTGLGNRLAKYVEDGSDNWFTSSFVEKNADGSYSLGEEAKELFNDVGKHFDALKESGSESFKENLAVINRSLGLPTDDFESWPDALKEMMFSELINANAIDFDGEETSQIAVEDAVRRIKVAAIHYENLSSEIGEIDAQLGTARTQDALIDDNYTQQQRQIANAGQTTAGKSNAINQVSAARNTRNGI